MIAAALQDIANDESTGVSAPDSSSCVGKASFDAPNTTNNHYCN